MNNESILNIGITSHSPIYIILNSFQTFILLFLIQITQIQFFDIFTLSLYFQPSITFQISIISYSVLYFITFILCELIIYYMTLTTSALIIISISIYLIIGIFSLLLFIPMQRLTYKSEINCIIKEESFLYEKSLLEKEIEKARYIEEKCNENFNTRDIYKNKSYKYNKYNNIKKYENTLTVIQECKSEESRSLNYTDLTEPLLEDDIFKPNEKEIYNYFQLKGLVNKSNKLNTYNNDYSNISVCSIFWLIFNRSIIGYMQFSVIGLILYYDAISCLIGLIFSIIIHVILGTYLCEWFGNKFCRRDIGILNGIIFILFSLEIFYLSYQDNKLKSN